MWRSDLWPCLLGALLCTQGTSASLAKIYPKLILRYLLNVPGSNEDVQFDFLERTLHLQNGLHYLLAMADGESPQAFSRVVTQATPYFSDALQAYMEGCRLNVGTRKILLSMVPACVISYALHVKHPSIWRLPYHPHSHRDLTGFEELLGCIVDHRGYRLLFAVLKKVLLPPSAWRMRLGYWHILALFLNASRRHSLGIINKRSQFLLSLPPVT
jgi:hypothetical protein